jgi:hypothetical protein
MAFQLIIMTYTIIGWIEVGLRKDLFVGSRIDIPVRPLLAYKAIKNFTKVHPDVKRLSVATITLREACANG